MSTPLCHPTALTTPNPKGQQPSLLPSHTPSFSPFTPSSIPTRPSTPANTITPDASFTLNLDGSFHLFEQQFEDHNNQLVPMFEKLSISPLKEEHLEIKFDEHDFPIKNLQSNCFSGFTNPESLNCFNIASFLSSQDMAVLLRVSFTWKKCFDTQEIWKFFFKNSCGYVFGRRSWCSSWKHHMQLIQAKDFRPLDVSPQTTILDLKSQVDVKSERDCLTIQPTTKGDLKIEAYFELYPQFFWINGTYRGSPFSSGLLLDNGGCTPSKSGMEPFKSILEAVTDNMKQFLTLRTVVLMLISLDVFPLNFDIEALIGHPNSTFALEPFELRLAISRVSLMGCTLYLKATPSNPLTCGPIIVDENFNHHHGADLILSGEKAKLWKCKLKKRKAPTSRANRQVLRRLS
jgi:hypothetical protein